jgi:NADPH-dependent curcumin reductase CurA
VPIDRAVITKFVSLDRYLPSGPITPDVVSVQAKEVPDLDAGQLLLRPLAFSVDATTLRVTVLSPKSNGRAVRVADARPLARPHHRRSTHPQALPRVKCVWLLGGLTSHTGIIEAGQVESADTVVISAAAGTSDHWPAKSLRSAAPA